MVKLTRNGVCYNLQETPYKYENGKIILHFSSLKNMEKFHSRKTEERNKLYRSLYNRFKISINISILSDILLYTKIEKRGFFITLLNGEEITCLDNLTLGGIQIKKKDLRKR